MTPEKIREKEAWSGSRDPYFWALNVNSSKMAKAANLKFGVQDPR